VRSESRLGCQQSGRNQRHCERCIRLPMPLDRRSKRHPSTEARSIVSGWPGSMNGATRWCRKGSSRNARASSCQKLLPKIEPIAVYDLLQKGFPFGVADHAIQSRIDRVLDARSAKNTARFGHLILIQLNRCPCHHEHSVPSDGRDMYQYPKVCVPGDGWAWPTSEVDFSVEQPGFGTSTCSHENDCKGSSCACGGRRGRGEVQVADVQPYVHLSIRSRNLRYLLWPDLRGCTRGLWICQRSGRSRLR
jgi:hypothetical protein